MHFVLILLGVNLGKGPLACNILQESESEKEDPTVDEELRFFLERMDL